MNAVRVAGRLFLLSTMLGIVSCSEQMPSQPEVTTPEPPLTYVVPNDSTVAANRALWTSFGFQDYRYRFRWSCFCVPEYIRLVDVTVRQGRVVSVVDVSTGKPLDQQALARYRTIDQLFDFVQDAVDRPADAIGSVFDPDLGYPAAAYVDYQSGIADDELSYRIYSLTLLRLPKARS